MTTTTPSTVTDINAIDFLPDDFSAGIDQSKPCEVSCLCPFCGSFNSGVGKPCSNCALEDTTAMRSATTHRTGPWYVLQTRNPSAPGMNFDTLISLIHKQMVTPRSVVRGPTTGQLWRLASKVRGISREFGQCFGCGEDIATDAIDCPHCERVQTLPDNIEARGEVGAESAQPVMPLAPVATPIEKIFTSPPVSSSISIEQESVTDQIENEPTPSRIELLGPAEPVISNAKMAEHLERHIPKEDLLTAKDVAKAFLLEFGPAAVAPAPPVKRVRPARQWDMAKIKVAMSIAAVLVLAAGIWPVIHAVAGWFESDAVPAAVIPVESQTPMQPVNNNADAQLANEIAIPQHVELAIQPARVSPPMSQPAMMLPPVIQHSPPPVPQPIAVAQVIAPPVMVQPTAPAPVVVEPIIYKKPKVAQAPEMTDDPTELMKMGMEAESHANFAGAVKAYERIESLPSDSWPAHLDVRLTLARRELSGDCR